MTSPVKIRLGDMFDGSSDLIVLPCSTNGTVTNFVAKALRNYKIPHPKHRYKLGEVDLRPFEGGESIAQFMAFAASVDNMTSNIEAIRSIGAQIGAYTSQEDSIRAVSVPLLGAGAGGLLSGDVVQALSDSFRSKAHHDAILTISVLHKNVFDRLASDSALVKPLAQPQEQEIHHGAIRLFISYTGTSPEHRSWVVELATFLRMNGVEARLDQWHLRKGMDLPHWMTNELEMADRVLVISDAQYASKADGRLGGVGWETMIIQGDLSNLPPDDNKYLVIVKEENVKEGLPRYLKTKFCIHWPSGGNDNRLQQDLLKEIYNVSLEPPVGEPPIWL